MTKILCLGILVSDTIVKPVHPDIFQLDTARIDEVVQATGGDAMNQEKKKKKLGNRVALAGMVGCDLQGDALMNRLQAAFVNTAHIRKSKRMGTAMSILLCEENGERHVLYYPGANSEFCMEETVDLGEYDILTIGSLYGIPRMDDGGFETLLPVAKGLGMTVVADMTANIFDLPHERITALFPYIDYLCPSEAEASVLTGEKVPRDMVKALRRMGVKAVILKAGGDGCYVGLGDQVVHIPAYPDIPVVDTTGAGDSFVAGFVHALGKGMDVQSSARFASAVGAVSVGALGATSAIADEAQIMRFMKTHEMRTGGADA